LYLGKKGYFFVEKAIYFNLGHMSFPYDLDLSLNKIINLEKLERKDMKGSIFAFLGGAFITLQGVATTRISGDVGTWQAATITQFTGFLVSLIILMFVRDKKLQRLKLVKPLYLSSGAFAAIIIFSNVTSIHYVGVTLAISAALIAQLSLTFLIDGNGWFEMVKQKMRLPQFIGIAMMIAGVVILRF
jgi:bacterial/archaeal transporter family-2 protein